MCFEASLERDNLQPSVNTMIPAIYLWQVIRGNYDFTNNIQGADTTDLFLLTIAVVIVLSLSVNLSYHFLVGSCSDFFKFEHKYYDYKYESFEECIYDFKGTPLLNLERYE